ncbi:hypothetical protein [Micromonospora sp. NPDC051296]|uniref:hypothetical protein n=1 Tax=Micromonospora sp. NPDC051296 TaxID=3155046 RepID=UPI003421F9BC
MESRGGAERSRRSLLVLVERRRLWAPVGGQARVGTRPALVGVGVVDGARLRVALVTGANHGIGAATAVALAPQGTAVLVTYLRLDDPPDPGIPETYRPTRSSLPSATGTAARCGR